MKRRNLIKTLGISAVGLAVVPYWLNSWTSDELPENDGFLPGNVQLELLEVVNIIIPKTNTPGAKELEVNKFISTIVRDCYDENVKTEFLDGFVKLNKFSIEVYGDSFLKITEAERFDVVCTLEEVKTASKEQINFISFIKDLTIRGFMSSKYVMENHSDYEFIPSRFYGSFPLKQSIYTNA